MPPTLGYTKPEVCEKQASAPALNVLKSLGHDRTGTAGSQETDLLMRVKLVGLSGLSGWM